MHFIPEDLNDAYMSLRMQICDAPKPLSWVQQVAMTAVRSRKAHWDWLVMKARNVQASGCGMRIGMK